MKFENVNIMHLIRSDILDLEPYKNGVELIKKKIT